jgi:hypothetical protein
MLDASKAAIEHLAGKKREDLDTRVHIKTIFSIKQF